MPSTRSGTIYKPSSGSQKGCRHNYGRIQSDTGVQGSLKDLHNSKLSNSSADDTILPSKRADTATRSLSGHLQSQPEGLQQCTAAQRVPDRCRSVKKLHELIPDCKKIPGSSQHLKVTQWMASIDVQEEYDAFNSRREEKQPSTTKASSKTSPSGQKQKFQSEKAATSSKQGQMEGTSPKALQPGIQDFKHSAGCHGRYISDGQSHDGITEEGGSQIKIPEMISDIFDSIPESHRWYIKLRQAHGHQIWTWWKTQIINKWANDAWRFKVETAFESAKINSDKDKALPWFCKQKYRLTALYPYMSEFMIHRKILRQCG
ncbi:hypothetical protein O181_083250, partial [Austropuccinia psidii MF-1]|nr:hypothetical protein [Austropuccinia psidii MF-1]